MGIDLIFQVLILKGLCDWRMEECEEISAQMRSETFAVSMVRFTNVCGIKFNMSYRESCLSEEIPRIRITIISTVISLQILLLNYIHFPTDMRLYRETLPLEPVHQTNHSEFEDNEEEETFVSSDEEDSSSDVSFTRTTRSRSKIQSARRKPKQEESDEDEEEENDDEYDEVLPEGRRVTRSHSRLDSNDTNGHTTVHSKSPARGRGKGQSRAAGRGRGRPRKEPESFSESSESSENESNDTVDNEKLDSKTSEVSHTSNGEDTNKNLQIDVKDDNTKDDTKNDTKGDTKDDTKGESEVK